MFTANLRNKPWMDKKKPMFIKTITVSNNISKQQNTIISQLLQYACVHLQIDRGVWNLLEEGKNW